MSTQGGMGPVTQESPFYDYCPGQGWHMDRGMSAGVARHPTTHRHLKKLDLHLAMPIKAQSPASPPVDQRAYLRALKQPRAQPRAGNNPQT